MPELFRYNQPITLESGASLPAFHLAYTTHGQLNESGDNVVWVFHALTANSDPAEWWPGLVGEDKLFDPSVYFIVCVNMPGSCYGSSCPLDKDPRSKEPYYHDFPLFTTRDMVRAYRPLKEFLGIKKIYIGIGGSMGGQQLLEWAIEEPELFRFIFPIATNAQHSAWGIAFNTSQRMAIETDGTWRERKDDAGLQGMKAARATALLSYRNYETYLKLQPRGDGYLVERATPGSGKDAASYQRYQGDKLAKRFSAFSYYNLSLSMDSHDVGRGRGGVEKALKQVRAATLVIGIDTDILFPLTEQLLLASLIPGASFQSIYSLYGHDGFLLESAEIERLVKAYIRDKSVNLHSFSMGPAAGPQTINQFNGNT